jgi:HEAT repeat protein
MALFTYLLTTYSTCLAAFPTDISGQMLFAIHRGEIQKGFESYLTYAQESQTQDFALLQQAAKALLTQGIHSKDPAIELMCMFGAGVATSTEMLPILEKGIYSEDLRTQLVALSYLGRLQDDEADRLLLEALSSPFVIVRLEALLQLAQKSHPATMGHLYSLMVKVPPPLRALLAQIAIHVEGTDATRFLRQLLSDPEVDVRVETILTVAEAGRDDFLPTIRLLAHGASYAEQENCALAFGLLKDPLSCVKLKSLSESRQQSVKLAACKSLYQLGEMSYLTPIETEAKQGCLFAITLLGDLQAGKETLTTLLLHPERDVRLNAILALLAQRDLKVLAYVDEILLDDARDTGFWRISSPGGGLKAWKTLPSANSQQKQYPDILEQTMNLREKVLVQCLEFEENDFLKVARTICQKKQTHLIPLVIELLQNKKSDLVIQFLKEGYQKAGAPLLRNYCTLALFRLNEIGPYEEQLISWINSWGSEELIRFKDEPDPLPFSNPHHLTPEETSRFLIEAYEALASAQNPTGIRALIQTIANGNIKNRYALAGLLMRTTE